jgi:hypothetical protein
VLEIPEWQSRKGLLGFVAHTNFSSRRGQAKSGFRKVGSLWLLGESGRLLSWRTGGLRRMGIRRVHRNGSVP